MAWSTTIIILQGGRHVWRFLGDSANDLEDFLFFLPEPYNLARDNSFKWVAEYLDSMEEAEVTFNHMASYHSIIEQVPTLTGWPSETGFIGATATSGEM